MTLPEAGNITKSKPSVVEAVSQLQGLSKIVSSPFRRFENQAFKARAFLGLLILALVSGKLRMDFYALMHIAGITLQGPDEDRWKRRRLRRFVESLVETGVAGAEKIIYLDVKIRLREEPIRTEDRVPAEGIVCLGSMKHVGRKPWGKIPKTYWLKLPRLDTLRMQVLDLAFSESNQPDPSVIGTVSSEVQTTHDFLRKLIRANRVEVEGPADQVSAKLVETYSDRVAYVLGCFENSRGIVKRLCAIMPLLSGIEERTHAIRSNQG